MRREACLVILCFSVMTGCVAHSLGNGGGDDRIVLTDATKRALTVVNVKASPEDRRVLPQRVVCAEPSPDIAKAVSTALESSLKAKADVVGKAGGTLDAALTRTETESIAQLGSRLATIQLLRDELSDLCRAYANGAVSSITYTLRLSRLDKKMITLLVSEASAGALSRALVSINGTAATSPPVSSEKLAAAEERVQAAVKAASTASADLDKANAKVSEATDEATKKVAKEAVTKAEDALRSRLSELTDRVLEKWAMDTRGSGLLASSTASAIAGLPNGSSSLQSLDLRAIHRAYLDDDDLGTLLDACLTSMEDNALLAKPANAQIEMLKGQLRQKQVQFEKKSTELKTLEFAQERLRSPNMPPASSEDIKKKDALRTEVNVLSVEAEQLQRQINEESGVQDRTALLSFCRGTDGLRRIMYLMERKISDRANVENTKNYIDLCKTALGSGSVSSTVQSSCVKTLLVPGDPDRASSTQ